MDVRYYLKMIQRGWWIVVLTTGAALGVALAASTLTTPMYQASVRFIVNPNASLTIGRDVVNSLEALDKRSIISTYAEILNSKRIYDEALAALHMGPGAASAYSLSSVVLPDANILELTATGPGPNTVAQLANQAGYQAITYIGGLHQVYDVSVLDSASPPAAPFNRQPLRDAGLALALGFTFGALLAIFRERLPRALGSLRRPLPFGATSIIGRRGRRQLEGESARSRANRLTLSLADVDVNTQAENVDESRPAQI